VLIAWLLFPLVLAALALGCGLLLQRAAGSAALPNGLLLPAGIAVIVVASLFPPLFESTAFLATPLVVALAAIGYGVAWPFEKLRPDWWGLGAAAVTYVAFGAPVLAAWRETFLGYIKLDDTATYLAMLDRFLGHGYNVSGLAASTYARTLETSLSTGYPMGSLMPLGVGHTLLSTDTAWLWQPYLSFLAAMVAVGIYALAAPIVRGRPLRALAAATAASAALLYGYALWGGIKELSEAFLLVLIAALLPAFLRAPGVRSALPLAIAAAATVGVQSAAGAAWLAVPALIAAVALARRPDRRASAWAAGGLVVAALVLAIPTLSAATMSFGHTGAFTSGSEYGNLACNGVRQPLDWTQIFGIWPTGDFRCGPVRTDVTGVLVALVVLGAILAIVVAWRRRGLELLTYAITALVASSFFWWRGSPWIGGKAIAIASPLCLSLALIAAGWVFEQGRRVEAVLAIAAIVFGVAWSDSLAYHDAFLAPNARLSELEAIGNRFAGQGPALEQDYDPYGARHFLRKLDAEATSELRFHPILLRTGQVLQIGATADLDEIALPDLLYYRTLVIRDAPSTSRPPSIYEQVAAGRHYQVWQRPVSGFPQIVEHLSLGDRFHAAAVPKCSDVLRLAQEAGPTGRVAAVIRPSNIAVDLSGAPPGTEGGYGETAGLEDPSGSASWQIQLTAPATGDYEIGIDGSFRSRLELLVDGHKVASDRNVQNWPGNYEPLATVQLGKGTHRLEFRYDGPDINPGSAGSGYFGLGPVIVGRAGPGLPVTYVKPANARSLCGKSLDWVEAVRPS
jgi:hypothetical protein